MNKHIWLHKNEPQQVLMNVIATMRQVKSYECFTEAENVPNILTVDRIPVKIEILRCSLLIA